MDVNMDGLRKRLILSYNSLTKKLNKSIKKYNTFSDEIVIDPHEIESEMESIRNGLVTLAFCYLEGPGGFSELDEDTHFEVFNELNNTV